jgi:methyl-accepting chemotaxis protein
VNLEVMDEAMLANDKPSGHGGLENDWYSCSIRSKALCLLEPYVDEVGTQQVLMTSVTVPLLDQGPAWHGGGRHLLGTLQSLVEEMGRTSTRGRARCFCSAVKGGWPAWKVPRRPWQSAGAARAGAGSQGWLTKGDVVTRWSPDGALLQTFVPVSMRGTDRKWGIYIELPRAVVLASALQLQGELEDQAQRSVATQLTIGGGISALALLCIWLMAQRIVAPIRAVVARLKDIASGRGISPSASICAGMTR